jgi:hypothetical protein
MARFRHSQIPNVLSLVAGTDSTGQDRGSNAPALNGYFRAGSDFRKDGEAVGW